MPEKHSEVVHVFCTNDIHESTTEQLSRWAFPSHTVDSIYRAQEWKIILLPLENWWSLFLHPANHYQYFLIFMYYEPMAQVPSKQSLAALSYLSWKYHSADTPLLLMAHSWCFHGSGVGTPCRESELKQVSAFCLLHKFGILPFSKTVQSLGNSQPYTPPPCKAECGLFSQALAGTSFSCWAAFSFFILFCFATATSIFKTKSLFPGFKVVLC